MKRLLLAISLLFLDLSIITWLDHYPIKWVFIAVCIVGLENLLYLVQVGSRSKSFSASYVLSALTRDKNYVLIIPILIVRIGLFYVHETGLNYDSSGSGSYITASFFSVASFLFWSACLKFLQPRLKPTDHGLLIIILFLVTMVALYTILPAMLMAMVLGFN